MSPESLLKSLVWLNPRTMTKLINPCTYLSVKGNINEEAGRELLIIQSILHKKKKKLYKICTKAQE